MASFNLNNKNITLVFLSGITIYQAFVIGRLLNRLKTGQRQFNKLHEISDYFLEIINENDIELTEFDLIALTAITEENNASC